MNPSSFTSPLRQHYRPSREFRPRWLRRLWAWL